MGQSKPHKSDSMQQKIN